MARRLRVVDAVRLLKQANDVRVYLSRTGPDEASLEREARLRYLFDGAGIASGLTSNVTPLFVCVDQEGIVHCLGYSTSAILCCDGKLDDGEGATRLLSYDRVG
jgi:hypothetical protein